MRAWFGWIVIALALVAVFYFLSQRVQNRVRTGSAEAKIGEPAPDFRGDFAVNGKPVSLSDLHGNVVLVDFWAVWCGPCIAAFEHLRDWNKLYKADGLVIVGVTDQEARTEPEKLMAFAAQNHLEYLLMTMKGENHARTCHAYDVIEIPRVVLIDRKGVLRAEFVGNEPATAEEIERTVKKLLSER